MLQVESPAKLNLFLYVLNRRADGFHNLQSLLQILAWGDSISLQPRSDGQIKVSGVDAVAPADNLAYQAALLLRQHCDCALGVDIHIDKKIPLGSGLGGGSSNAAAVLKALNQLWELQLNKPQLQQLALQLGSDVPLFIESCSAYAEGRGELLTPVHLPLLHYLLLFPPVTVSSGDIFHKLALTTNKAKKRIAPFAEGSFIEPDFAGWANDLEAITCSSYSLLSNCKSILDSCCYQPLARARMSGSGSTLFVPFADLDLAQRSYQACYQPVQQLHCRIALASSQA